jgi:hypothetical protein
MINVQKETERLVKRFIAQLEAIGIRMAAETKAVSWQMASEVIAAGLQAIAVGSLGWNDTESKPRTTKLAVPVQPARTLAPRVYGPKARDKAYQSTERATRYRILLDNQTGYWARRDGKVKYRCFGTRRPSSRQVGDVWYRMKRTDNGEERDIKLSSIVSDWIHIDA